MSTEVETLRARVLYLEDCLKKVVRLTHSIETNAEFQTRMKLRATQSACLESVGGMEEIVVTEEIVKSLYTPKGGITRTAMDLLNLPRPPVKGWKRRVIGTAISRQKYVEFLRANGRLLPGEIES